MAISITRQELYDRVWAAPIDRLCEEFGMSNVGPGQGVPTPRHPVPARGYWQQRPRGIRSVRRRSRP
jgi:hypothetical protein